MVTSPIKKWEPGSDWSLISWGPEIYPLISFIWFISFANIHQELAQNYQPRMVPAIPQDVLYLDKNADVGVSWRRAGPFERFSEVRCGLVEVTGANRSVH